MDDVFVARLMSTELKTVAPGTLVEDAATVMLDNQVSSVLVVESGQIRGIVTSTDFVRIVSQSQPKAETPVDRYMTTDVSTATAQDTVQEVANMMVEHGVHHIPVVDDEEELIGIITAKDMTGYLSTRP